MICIECGENIQSGQGVKLACGNLVCKDCYNDYMQDCGHCDGYNMTWCNFSTSARPIDARWSQLQSLVIK